MAHSDQPLPWFRILFSFTELREVLSSRIRDGGLVLPIGFSSFRHMFFETRCGNVNWIPGLLFKSPQPWLLDDFSSLEICLIGIVARVDAVFRDQLKRELANYRPPPSLSRTNFADNLFEATFGYASIERHFRTLSNWDQRQLLKISCRTGPSSMVKPFIDM